MLCVVLSALAATGCTLLYQPDRDAIVRHLDGGVDGGPDASDSGAIDAGPDGGPPCVPSPEDCEDGAQLDEDCDGESNCFDFDCRGNATCCRPGMLLSRCPASATDFVALPTAAASDIVFSDFDCAATSRVTEFGPSGRARALVTPQCERITFGMRLTARFVRVRECAGPCDYAALSFGPVRTLVDGDPFASELRIMLSSDGSMRVDRAGTPIGDPAWGPGTIDVGEQVDVEVELEPGPDDSGQDVLYATVEVTPVGGPGDYLLRRTAVAPLAALECIDPGGGASQVGLYVALEGAGDDVEVVGDLRRTENQCSNPSQFLPDTNSVHTADVETCAPGGIGAPALVNYCRSNCDAGAQIQWDLWVDASLTPRIEESFRYVDYGMCGYAVRAARLPTAAWTPRAGGGFMLGDSPSAREPTLLAVSDDGAGTRVSRLFYAYAERTAPETEIYAIVGGTVDTLESRAPVPFARALLTAEEAGCVSVRDPLLVADYAGAAGAAGYLVDGAWLLFTCEHPDGDPDSIGVAHFRGSEELIRDGNVRTDVLVAERGTYSDRGVFAPEGFGEAADGELTVRLWYLARDGTGQVRLAHAQGRVGDLERFPAIEPYPANPILAANSRVLGDCASGCTITGATVTPSFIAQGDWQFLISRSRLTGTGTVHELVPLLQFAPND